MSTGKPRIYLYGDGTLGTANPPGSVKYVNAATDGLGSGDLINRLYANNIRDAGYTDLILWTLHVWPNGDVYYGDSLAASCGKVNAVFKSWNMDARVTDLKQGGGMRVVFGIGDGGKTGDFQIIQDLMASPTEYQIFLSNLQALSEYVGTDGFDFDMEVYIASTETVAKLVTDIVAMKQMVSFSPTTEQETPWVIPVLKKLYADTGSQPVSWLNVQSYSEITDGTVTTWIDALDSSTGVTDPEAFVGFALAVTWGYTLPSNVQAQYTGLSTKPGGGGMWHASAIVGNVGQSEPTSLGAYASAIQTGLGDVA